MKTFLITIDNNVLFRLVINLSRNKTSSLGGDVLSQDNRDWFDNAIVRALASVDKVLLPITQSRSSSKQDELCFTLQQPENTSIETIADLIERSLTSIVYGQWCKLRGFSSDDDEDYLSELKRVVLGVGVKFKRKNEK